MPGQRKIFDQRQLKYIAGLQIGREAELPPQLGKIVEGLGIGHRRGRAWCLSAPDIERLRTLARESSGWDLTSPLDGGARHTAPLDDEKAGGRRAYEGVLLVRRFSSQLPGASALHIDDIDRSFGSLMIVENASLMFHFHRLDLDWPRGAGDALVVYRGDRQFSPASVTRLIEETQCPIDVVPDLDLEGLRIAARFAPRLRNLVLPRKQDLPVRRRINHDRHLMQLSKGGGECPLPDHHDISRWWSYLMETESAIPQESWIRR